MKRLFLCVAALLLFSTAAIAQDEPIEVVQTTSEPSTFFFGGVNHEAENWGVFFGVGQRVGRVTLIPYARYTIDSTAEELRFSKTFGAETIIWLYRTDKFKAGLLASALNLDWIDNQEETVGTYFSQSGGLDLFWRASNDFALNLHLKYKTQLFNKDTLFDDIGKKVDIGLAAIVSKFW